MPVPAQERSCGLPTTRCSNSAWFSRLRQSSCRRISWHPEISCGVHLECCDTWRYSVLLAKFTGGFAFRRSKRGNIDQGLDLVAGAGLRNHRATPRVTDQHDFAGLCVNDALRGGDVIGQRSQRILYGDHFQALGLQQRDHLLPARSISKGAMDKNNGGSVSSDRRGLCTHDRSRQQCGNEDSVSDGGQFHDSSLKEVKLLSALSN